MGQTYLKIHELVAKIEHGEIRLPEMQRHYVWKATRVRDLLDSLYRGYPSGNILTWETDEPVPTREFSIAQEKGVQRSYQLLLDGQQRLTSLSAILRGEEVIVRGRKKPIDILFNLEHPEALEIVSEVEEDIENNNGDLEEDDEEEVADANEDELLKRFDRMAFVVRTEKLAARPNWVSVTEVFRENSDKPFLEKAGIRSWDDPRHEKYVERLRRLRAIRDYRYDVYVLDREKSYEEVTEIFVRVNSLGAKLRSSDLALAQITATWHDSLKIFQAFEAECIKLGFNLGLALHLKNLVAFATGQSRFKTVGNLSQEELEEAWKLSKKGMHFALNFLSSNAGIDSQALLSSPFLVVALAYYGHQKDYKLSQAEERQLRYWVLTANAKGRYSRGSSETFLDQDLGVIRREESVDALIQLLRTQAGRLQIIPSDLENRNIRSSYFKTMFLAFRKDGAQDWHSQVAISLKHAGAQEKLQFHHIFPQDVLKKAGVTTTKINDICNLCFIGGKTNRKISNKQPSEYLPNIMTNGGKEALMFQQIPIDPTLWTVEQYDAFLTERRRLVADRLNNFLGHASTEAVFDEVTV